MPIGFAGWALVANTATSAYAANRAADAASDQMSFQADQTGTAHQRQVADLRAAGLNPILSATGGRGAASGSGAMPSQFLDASQGVSSALQAKKQDAEIGLLRASEFREFDSARAARSQADLADEQRRGHMLDNVGREARIRSGALDALIGAEKEQSKASSAASAIERDIDEGKVGEWSRILRRLLPGLNSAAGAARSIR